MLLINDKLSSFFFLVIDSRNPNNHNRLHNSMSYSIYLKEESINLRRKGYSIKEISEILNISKSTSSTWVKHLNLNDKAKLRLQKRKILGQYKAMKTRKIKREKIKEEFKKKAIKSLKKIRMTKELYKLLCSFLFWTEGGKSSDSYLFFINSDPNMVKTFITLLRKAFSLDESKLRSLVHIHEYHNEKKILNYWSNITGISLKQFSKSYLKPHTKKRIREGYMGSIRVRYYDYKTICFLKNPTLGIPSRYHLAFSG